ncbi:hypothetical protein BF17_06960 [Yersinia similis]|uniref:Entero membrane protein n=1 Tax=Yersinia similis TaxID=367190 RepID=A0ABM5PXI9_9GAMM|nr:DUF943 family protein [Yersinia similis]AHK19085.1 hypothetical protein BF17_06960 [Yersinia similis]CFQ66912.1 putative entero membrane protein [Yersinia similis]CNB64583.1 putative entero membrane protein [Yersinia similis]CNF29826.1 putative entero membrane protein [Yersinia similis]
MLKIKRNILLGIFAVGLLFIIWIITQPVEIVAVHQDRHYSFILAKNFPITDKEKIAWWEKNKIMLKEKYDLPKEDLNGYYLVSVWSFGDGYKKLPTGDMRLSLESSDLLCFDDMKVVENCIEKKSLLFIRKYDDRYVFSIGRSSYRQSVEGGEITKDAED